MWLTIIKKDPVSPGRRKSFCVDNIAVKRQIRTCSIHVDFYIFIYGGHFSSVCRLLKPIAKRTVLYELKQFKKFFLSFARFSFPVVFQKIVILNVALQIYKSSCT